MRKAPSVSEEHNAPRGLHMPEGRLGRNPRRQPRGAASGRGHTRESARRRKGAQENRDRGSGPDDLGRPAASRHDEYADGRDINSQPGHHAMRGLCHGCLTSNIEITITDGKILCADCTGENRTAEKG